MFHSVGINKTTPIENNLVLTIDCADNIKRQITSTNLFKNVKSEILKIFLTIKFTSSGNKNLVGVPVNTQ